MAGEGKFIDNLMVGDLVVDGVLKTTDSKKFLKETFSVSPVCNTVAGAAAATTGANLMSMEGRTYLLNQIATQTLVAPLMAATGLDVTGDQTADDGREIDFSGLGTLGAKSAYSYTVGARAFYGKLKFSIAVVLGTDICCFGFRKAAAHNADPAAYTDYAVLDVNNGNISVSTNLNSAGESNTDTTDDWADAETHTLEVYISAAGVATFKIDGVAPTTTATVTLDSGDVMIPFFEFLHDASADTGALVLQDLECSYV